MNKFVLLWIIVLAFACNSSSAKQKKAVTISSTEQLQSIRNIEPIIQFWKSVCKGRHLEYTIEEYRVLEQKDEQTGKPFWILLGVSKDGHLRMAMQLFVSGKEIQFTSASVGKGMVICQGKPQVCTIPGMMDGQWTCAKECGPDCTKIESVFYSDEEQDQLQAFMKEFK
ncbi:hypothetical protein [Edaphocola aurantiacus]|uniref:hypothetical protein n=1 Tax=Edaphocola aurantiacus TaxID=2601682 RepID=UPI001C97D0A0|nr:hypothetical protein [Edaphocola aurantiacus]